MQISTKTVAQDTTVHIENQFFKALASISDTTRMKNFLTAFLSETEANVLCKRFAILKMLTEGKSYSTIEESLKVSSATVSTISKLAQEPSIQSLIKELEAEDWANDMSLKLMGFFKKKDKKSEPVITETSKLVVNEGTVSVEEPQAAPESQNTVL